MPHGSGTISLKNQSRKAESACGVQSIFGRAWSPNPGQSTVTTRKLDASLSRSGRISSRVEIEVRAGNKTAVGPLPASSMPSVTSVPFHIQHICRAVAIWRPLLSGSLRPSVMEVAANVAGTPAATACGQDRRYRERDPTKVIGYLAYEPLRPPNRIPSWAFDLL